MRARGAIDCQILKKTVSMGRFVLWFCYCSCHWIPSAECLYIFPKFHIFHSSWRGRLPWLVRCRSISSPFSFPYQETSKVAYTAKEGVEKYEHGNSQCHNDETQEKVDSAPTAGTNRTWRILEYFFVWKAPTSLSDEWALFTFFLTACSSLHSYSTPTHWLLSLSSII